MDACVHDSHPVRADAVEFQHVTDDILGHDAIQIETSRATVLAADAAQYVHDLP